MMNWQEQRDKLAQIYGNEMELQDYGAGFYACEGFQKGYNECRSQLESAFEKILRLLEDEAVETAKEVCEENMSYKIK